ncbi:MAG TPA: methyltransferase domain-containing protein [Ramlibacter sp.]|jgi:SAM-dependent methyltransferase
MSDLQIDWSKLYAARNTVSRAFPSIWRIPVIKKEMDRLSRHSRPGAALLEVGAGDRRFERKIKAVCPDVSYQSFDIDRSTRQDYYDIDDIEGRHDLVYAFEVIEHLTPAQGVEMLRKLKRNLAPGGTLLLGTPNLYHPHRYFGDLTHVTPYKYEELGALLVVAGYRVEGFYRIFNDSFVRRALRLHFGVWLHRWLSIDFAHTVLVEAKVAPEAEDAGPPPTMAGSDGR